MDIKYVSEVANRFQLARDGVK